MNLEQVKEHFKFAKEVRCLGKSVYEGKIYKIDLTDVYYGEGKNKSVFCRTTDDSTDCKLYNSDTNQLAEILTYIFDRGEEVEVSDKDTYNKNAYSWKFLTFDSAGNAIVERLDSCGVYVIVSRFKHIRKLTPESLLEPQLSELKKVAEANGMSVTVIFNQK